ncbi:MAG: tetratricopeptide repeat protein [Smithella sp.]
MSALLLFWLFNRMTGAIWRSAFVAALFALHPLHVESVAWISERKDVLSVFFWILTLCLYVYYTEKPVIKRYLLVVFSFVLALMSKPMVVTLPVIMIFLDYWPLERLQSQKATTNLTNVMLVSTNQSIQETKPEEGALNENISPPNKRNKRKLSETKIAGIIPLWQIWEKIPFFILSTILVIITLYNPNQQDTSLKAFSLISRLANAPVAFVTYLEKTFWPNNLAIFYPFPYQIPAWQVLGATILILVISAVVIAAAKRLPYLFVGWMWFAITILPVIGILQISLTTPYSMADRYHYLPSIGIAVILAWGIPLLIKREDTRKKILLPAAIAVLAILTVLTWRQCGYWKNSSELWSHALSVTKNNYIAHSNLGIALFEEGKIEEAIDQYNKAIMMPYQILTYNDDHLYYFYGRIYSNRGKAYAELGLYKYAFEDYNKSIRLNSKNASLYNSRGFTYAKLNQHQRAIEDFSEAIRLRPDFAYYYLDRGNSYNKLGQHQSALDDYTNAIRLKPGYADAYNNRGVAYAKLGQYQRAIEDFNKAIYIKQDYADAYNNRRIAYFKQGSKKLCCDDLIKACKLGNCKTLEAARNRGNCR